MKKKSAIGKTDVCTIGQSLLDAVDTPEVVKVPVATIENNFLRRECKIQGVIRDKRTKGQDRIPVIHFLDRWWPEKALQ